VDVDVLGIERSRANLTEVQKGLDPSSGEYARVQRVIDFLDFASGVLGNSENVLTTTAMPLHVETSGLAARDTSILAIALPGALAVDPLLAAITLVLAALAAATLGALAAGLTRATSGAALLAVLFLTPMLLLGGLFYPVAYMPPAARLVSSALPVTLATDA